MSSEGWVQLGVSWGQTGSSADRAETRCAQAVADRLPCSQLTWRTEQIWNMENRKNMEHGEQNEVESRKKLEHVQGRSGQLNF